MLANFKLYLYPQRFMRIDNANSSSPLDRSTREDQKLHRIDSLGSSYAGQIKIAQDQGREHLRQSDKQKYDLAPLVFDWDDPDVNQDLYEVLEATVVAQ